MKGKVAILRLSPNEEDRIIREEFERRRKLRIQQVREQQRCIALRIRRKVEQRRQHELEQLGKELKDKWEREQSAKISTLQKIYQENLQLLGQGQRSAKENEPDWVAIAQKEEENHAKAEERFRDALKELKSQKIQEHERQNRSIKARKKALEAERERSARVASLPLPPPNPIQNIDFKKPHRIKMCDINAFATTYYHMADRIVDREVDQIKPNAHEKAEVELERLQQMEMEKMRRREEQLEKAHIRGKQALRREHLEQDCERLLVELEHMQQTDQLRRRQKMAKMPPQIFQPLYKRVEIKEDFQRQMEFAFEDMYTEEQRVKGDLVVQLVPEPLPDLSPGSQDQELDVTLDDVAPPVSENTQPDTEQGARTSEQELLTQVEQTKPASKHPLKKLLDRIRSQRNQRTEHEAAVDTVGTDEIPEKDTTIDTGSLTSDQKSSELSVECHKTTQNGSETSKPPTAADTRLPDKRMKWREERKKRDEQLEREKLEQLALLQELEGQKAELEQLLKSQQERKRLQITHEEDQPESLTSHHEVSSSEATNFTLPSDEDDHAQQIREYQRQLLEQSRIHQRYVEVARERLVEYRRALQMQYKMAAEKGLPPPHLCTRSSQAAGGYSHLASSALQTSSHDEARTPGVVPTGGGVPVWQSRPPVIRLVPDVESLSDTRYQTTGDPVVTERHRDRFKPVSVTKELPSGSTTTPDTIQTVCPSVTDAPVQAGAFSQNSAHTLSVEPPKDPILRQTGEQQAAVLHHRRQHERHTWEVERLRQQKQYLQALIHIDAQTEPLTESTPEEDVSGNVGQSRRSLLESLIRAIEQQNGGTLSHLEDSQADKGAAPVQSEMLPQSSMLDESLSPKGGKEVQMLDQREPGELYPEEKEQEWETDVEFRGQRKEMSQPIPESGSEQLASEDIGQIRRKLFASLLKVVAETNKEALSQSEDAQEEDETTFNSEEAVSENVFAGPPPASVHPEALWFPAQATRPPVTRVKLAVWEMSEQHELSVIPEVETPVNTSLVPGLENTLRLPSRSVDQDPLEESDWARLKSCGQQIFEQSMISETSSGTSGHLVWTKRLLSSSESSPQVAVPTMTSPLSSDSGRGADYSGPAATTLTSPPEAALGAAGPESDCLSTISTGSYVTTDPEQNPDKSPTLVRVGQGAELLAVFSPPSGSICIQDSAAAGSPRLAVERLFSDSGIQRIIDKYTKELNFSLCSPGRPTEGEGLATQAPGASAADPSALLNEETNERTGSSPGSESGPSDSAAAQENSLQWASAASPGQEQDSFRPLVGQPADQSSCLTADQRNSALEHLLGQPSAHSSLIGQLPGLHFSASLDLSGWDSTLARMMDRFARPSVCQWQPGGQGPGDRSTTWFDGGPEDSRMKPLVEELDESAGQQMEGSAALLAVGERTLVDLSGSSEVPVPAEIPPGAPALDARPRPQARTTPPDAGPESSEVWDSFHPLTAELTHSEMADPSLNFDQPGHGSLDEQPSGGEPRAPASFNDDLSESERSLDSFRAEDAEASVTTPAASHDSFSLLITSQDDVHQSVLASPLREVEVRQTEAPGANRTHPQEPVGSGSVGKRTSEEGTGVSETADEKGILEQSQITLVSLTDTSLQDQDATLRDEAGSWGEEHPDVETESLLPAQPHRSLTLPATLLETDWEPGSGQWKRKVLLQRSSRRVEELKSKRAQQKSGEQLENSGEQLENSSRRPQVDTGPKGPAAVSPASPLPQTAQAEAPEVNARLCTAAQRRLEVSEMHRRTRRLYQQLEEVQQQKAVRSRQEASTQNRLKAKEFHKKTLQKLRAKQTPR